MGGDALAFMDQAEQEVLRADGVVHEEACLLLGQDDESASAVGVARHPVFWG